jgi:dephospho-CoA kinase
MKVGGKTGHVVVGLIGQVCAGKSTVAEAFKRRGAMIYDADQRVHEMYRRPEVIKEVSEKFGADVLDSSGQVDRKALGKIVFADSKKLRQLTETIIFPRTIESIKATLEEFNKSTSPLLILDAPTLFEAGRDDLCHYIVFVSAPLERRKEWAKSRGWNEDEIEKREGKMGRMSIKRRRADAVIENDGTKEDVDRKVGEVFDRWTKRD